MPWCQGRHRAFPARPHQAGARRHNIRQVDLANRAGLGRQWIGALEQGKPSLELGRVLRTLETLGLDLELRPTDPMPPWIIRAMHESRDKAI